MKRLVVFVVLALSGCAWSAAGLYESKVQDTLHSPKPAQAWATCFSEKLVGNNPLRNDGSDHWWVLRLNGYQVPIIRWDFFNDPTGGSRAELRSSVNIGGAAHDKVQGCA